MTTRRCLKSSVTAARLQADAEVAALLVKRAALAQKHALEEQMEILKRKKEELDLKLKILETEAKLAALNSGKKNIKKVTVGLSVNQNVVASITPQSTVPVTLEEDTGAGVDNNLFSLHTKTTSILSETTTCVSSAKQEQMDLKLKDVEQASTILELYEVANSEGTGPNTVNPQLEQGFGAPLKSTGQGRTGLPDIVLTVTAKEEVTEDEGSQKHLNFEVLIQSFFVKTLCNAKLILYTIICDNLSWPLTTIDKPQAVFYVKRPKAFKKKRWKMQLMIDI